jgi:hypothetical protein
VVAASRARRGGDRDSRYSLDPSSARL